MSIDSTTTKQNCSTGVYSEVESENGCFDWKHDSRSQFGSDIFALFQLS